MDIPGFSKEALLNVTQLLYAENQPNLYEGQCGQKKLKEQNKKPRTPAQEQADRARSQALSGKRASSVNRSEAAKKAAETRKRCKGSSTPKPPQAPQSPGVK
jgi:hypothetical protein